MGLFNIFSKKENKEDLNKGLEKTKAGVFSKLARAIAGKSKVDDEVLDNLEEVLITSDVGVDTTLRIIERIEKRVAADKYMNTSELNDILREEITNLLEENKNAGADGFSYEKQNGMPYVIMVVGVNGAGKTTTFGKLAAKLKQAGKKVYIGAADTFRAAAIDQLAVWAERAGVTMIRQEMGSDPASVAFDTLKSAEGVVLMDDPQNTVYPTPLECADRDEVFVGRVRLDPTVPSGINMWVVADNIRKGAATNAVQIAERIIAKAQAR